MFVGSLRIISRLDSQSKFQMLVLFSGRHVGGNMVEQELLQHGGSMLGYVILRKTTRRISEVWEKAET